MPSLLFILLILHFPQPQCLCDLHGARRHIKAADTKSIRGKLYRIRPAAAARVVNGLDAVPAQDIGQRIRSRIKSLYIFCNALRVSLFPGTIPKAIHTISFFHFVRKTERH